MTGPQRLAEALQCTQWRSLQCTSPSSIRPTAPATVDYDGDKSSHDEHNDDRADNHEERPTEGNGGREEHGEESAPSTSVDFGFNLDEGFERTCEKIQELRYHNRQTLDARSQILLGIVRNRCDSKKTFRCQRP